MKLCNLLLSNIIDNILSFMQLLKRLTYLLYIIITTFRKISSYMTTSKKSVISNGLSLQALPSINFIY